nr:hypothetical protein CFP56_08444 [Quercus suber]
MKFGQAELVSQLPLLLTGLRTSYLDEFQVANLRVKQTQPVSSVRWSLPHPPWYNVNVDGAIFENLREVGIRVIMRFAWKMGIRTAIFEGDSLVVFHSLLGSTTPPSSISNIIAVSLVQAQRFSDFKFSFVLRDDNKVAHGLPQRVSLSI